MVEIHQQKEDSKTERQGDKVSPGYQFFMLVLCLYALAELAVQAAFQLSPSARVILDYADKIVCVVFFADFLVSLTRATNRWKYLRTWGWLDFLSSIPMLDFVRWGRLARVVRAFRVLRGLRAAKLLAGMVMRYRAENTFLPQVWWPFFWLFSAVWRSSISKQVPTPTSKHLTMRYGGPLPPSLRLDMEIDTR